MVSLLGGSALLKATYRFFDHDDTDFTTTDMLAAHVQATYDRLASLPLVLAVSDTTLLDFSAHPATEGLGPLASPSSYGLLLHSPLACSPNGVPLDMLALSIWARDRATVGHQADHHTRPIADKESAKWLASLRHVGNE